MNKILDLLNKLDAIKPSLYHIQLFGDFSGFIVWDNNNEIEFKGEDELIQKLENLLNE